jgi:hypothetical protein
MSSAARLTLLLLVLFATAPLALAPQTHATRGIVKSASAAELVLSRFQNRGNITLALSRDTQIDGTIEVGATVSARYHDENGHHIANAVSVEHPH